MSSLVQSYIRATNSSNLRVNPLEPCDVDRLIAAGWAMYVPGSATPGSYDAQLPYHLRVVRVPDQGRMLAIELYRVKLAYRAREPESSKTGKRARPAFDALASYAAWQLRRDMRSSRAKNNLDEPAAIDIARRTLRCWLRVPSCKKCQGRGHPLIPGTQLVDTTRDCTPCNGTGNRLVEQSVYSEYREHARWIASHFDRLMLDVQGAMAAILARDFGEFV